MKKLITLLATVLLLLVPLAMSDSADITVTVGSAAPVVDSVFVGDANPTAGTTTQITITTQITDTNGVDDITEVSAEFTSGSPDNGNDVTLMTRSICTDVDTDTIECNATYDMQFYDEYDTYAITVTAKDAAGNNDTNSDTFDYSELRALELDVSAIAFGSMTVGQTKEVLGDETWGSGTATIKNQGNSVIDAKINATDFTGSTDSFGAEEAEARFGALEYNDLTNEEEIESGLNLAYGASVLENVDFKLTIPLGALPETYTSQVRITAVASLS
ncbi:hypothetical protein KY366_03105 [Candidatus Woesearchaeota archaeon]|nr:hypothetical protein [Candidatus Woesearchaeota archaeon]